MRPFLLYLCFFTCFISCSKDAPRSSDTKISPPSIKWETPDEAARRVTAEGFIHELEEAKAIGLSEKGPHYFQFPNFQAITEDHALFLKGDISVLNSSCYKEDILLKGKCLLNEISAPSRISVTIIETESKKKVKTIQYIFNPFKPSLKLPAQHTFSINAGEIREFDLEIVRDNQKENLEIDYLNIASGDVLFCEVEEAVLLKCKFTRGVFAKAENISFQVSIKDRRGNISSTTIKVTANKALDENHDLIPDVLASKNDNLIQGAPLSVFETRLSITHFQHKSKKTFKSAGKILPYNYLLFKTKINTISALKEKNKRLSVGPQDFSTFLIDHFNPYTLDRIQYFSSSLKKSQTQVEIGLTLILNVPSAIKRVMDIEYELFTVDHQGKEQVHYKGPFETVEKEAVILENLQKKVHDLNTLVIVNDSLLFTNAVSRGDRVGLRVLNYRAVLAPGISIDFRDSLDSIFTHKAFRSLVVRDDVQVKAVDSDVDDVLRSYARHFNLKEIDKRYGRLHSVTLGEKKFSQKGDTSNLRNFEDHTYNRSFWRIEGAKGLDAVESKRTSLIYTNLNDLRRFSRGRKLGSIKTSFKKNIYTISGAQAGELIKFTIKGTRTTPRVSAASSRQVEMTYKTCSHRYREEGARSVSRDWCEWHNKTCTIYTARKLPPLKNRIPKKNFRLLLTVGNKELALRDLLKNSTDRDKFFLKVRPEFLDARGNLKVRLLPFSVGPTLRYGKLREKDCYVKLGYELKGDIPSAQRMPAHHVDIFNISAIRPVQ